jgi:hypothetical protein
MIAGLLLLGALACVPDTVHFTPTPVLSWDHDLLRTVGYRPYFRGDGEPWTRCSDLLLWYELNDDGSWNLDGPTYRYGRDLPWPVQRCTDRQLEVLEWTIRAYNAFGESESAPPVTICMPQLWQRPATDSSAPTNVRITEGDSMLDPMSSQPEGGCAAGNPLKSDPPGPGTAGQPATADPAGRPGPDLDHIFTYHAPTPDQTEAYNELRSYAFTFANAIVRLTPRCADQTAAIRKVREAVMTANAAIALGGRQ